MTLNELVRLTGVDADTITAIAAEIGVVAVPDRAGVRRFEGYDPDRLYREVMARHPRA
jgi:hypothetical protein